MTDILKIDFTSSLDVKAFTLTFIFSWWFVVVIIFLGIMVYFLKFFFKQPQVKLKEVQLNIGQQKFIYKIERNYLNLEIAHKIYIELITRKAALPIDEKNDIIIEIYNSWYTLFKTTRDEIKAISGEILLNDPKSEILIQMVTKVLNEGLRPHLTRYQGKFRKWYEKEIDKDKNNELSPQQIQEKYPDFEALIASMKEVNLLLRLYADELNKFIYQDE